MTGDWPKYGNSRGQKTWTDAQPVCADSQHCDETGKQSGMELYSGRDEVAWRSSTFSGWILAEAVPPGIISVGGR